MQLLTNGKVLTQSVLTSLHVTGSVLNTSFQFVNTLSILLHKVSIKGKLQSIELVISLEMSYYYYSQLVVTCMFITTLLGTYQLVIQDYHPAVLVLSIVGINQSYACQSYC